MDGASLSLLGLHGSLVIGIEREFSYIYLFLLFFFLSTFIKKILWNVKNTRHHQTKHLSTVGNHQMILPHLRGCRVVVIQHEELKIVWVNKLLITLLITHDYAVNAALSI